MATITSKQSGNWSDPNTWNGGVPQNGDSVTISGGHIISYDYDMSGFANGISLTISDGTLQSTTVSGNYYIKFNNHVIFNHTNSKFIFGTQTAPLSSNVNVSIHFNGAYHFIFSTNISTFSIVGEYEPEIKVARLKTNVLSGTTKIYTKDLYSENDINLESWLLCPTFGGTVGVSIAIINYISPPTCEFATVTGTGQDANGYYLTLSTGLTSAKNANSAIYLRNRNIRLFGSTYFGGVIFSATVVDPIILSLWSYNYGHLSLCNNITIIGGCWECSSNTNAPFSYTYNLKVSNAVMGWSQYAVFCLDSNGTFENCYLISSERHYYSSIVYTNCYFYLFNFSQRADFSAAPIIFNNCTLKTAKLINVNYIFNICDIENLSNDVLITKGVIKAFNTSFSNLKYPSQYFFSNCEGTCCSCRFSSDLISLPITNMCKNSNLTIFNYNYIPSFKQITPGGKVENSSDIPPNYSNNYSYKLALNYYDNKYNYNGFWQLCFIVYPFEEVKFRVWIKKNYISGGVKTIPEIQLIFLLDDPLIFDGSSILDSAVMTDSVNTWEYYDLGFKNDNIALEIALRVIAKSDSNFTDYVYIYPVNLAKNKVIKGVWG